MAYSELVIDINDSTAKIYIKDVGLVVSEATLIAFNKTRNKTNIVAVGDEAKKLVGKTDDNCYIETPIKGGVIVNNELATILLKRFLYKAFDGKSFLPKMKALFVVNCALTPEEKRAYELLAINCGIDYTWFVPSVITSAIGGGLDVCDDTCKMIVEINQGATDIAVINQGSIVNGYSIELGCAVIEEAIVKTIYEQFEIVITLATAQNILMQVGSLYKSDISNIEFTGVDALTKTSKISTVFGKDLYVIFKVAFDKICEAIEIIINQLSADMANDIAQGNIYICGKGSKITGVENYMKKELSFNLSTLEDDVSLIGAANLLNNKPLLNQIITKN